MPLCRRYTRRMLRDAMNSKITVLYDGGYVYESWMKNSSASRRKCNKMPRQRGKNTENESERRRKKCKAFFPFDVIVLSPRSKSLLSRNTCLSMELCCVDLYIFDLDANTLALCKLFFPNFSERRMKAFKDSVLSLSLSLESKTLYRLSHFVWLCNGIHSNGRMLVLWTQRALNHCRCRQMRPSHSSQQRKNSLHFPSFIHSLHSFNIQWASSWRHSYSVVGKSLLNLRWFNLMAETEPETGSKQKRKMEKKRGKIHWRGRRMADADFDRIVIHYHIHIAARLTQLTRYRHFQAPLKIHNLNRVSRVRARAAHNKFLHL